ncbi:metallophosphoesterase [Latilactobacillus sakei]|uniref:metallophosphoesterase n=1 Tax=Latilactobacillus sakei TaxID=1599 RepID=UPI003CECC131
MKEPKLDDLMDEPSPFQNRDARNQKQHNWDVLRRFGKAVGGFLKNSVGEINNAIGDASDRMDDIEDRYNQQIAGNTNLNEVIDARDGEDTLRVKELKQDARLNVVENNTIGTLIFSDDLLPGGAYRVIFDAQVARIRANFDSDKFNVIVLTDLHYEQNNPEHGYGYSGFGLNHITNLNQISKFSDVSLLCGDNNNSRSHDLSTVKRQVKQVADYFLDSTTGEDRFIIRGNHDQGSLRGEEDNGGLIEPDNIVTDSDLKSAYRTSLGEYSESRDGDSFYFFKDYADKKVRLVVLDTNDNSDQLVDANGSLLHPALTNWNYRQKQVAWLANTALQNVPANYHTMIVQHVPLRTDYHTEQQTGNPNDIRAYYNHDAVARILRAFMDGDKVEISNEISDYSVNVVADFTKQGPRVLVGVFGGHTHEENINNVSGINVVEMLNSVCEPYGDMPTKPNKPIRVPNEDSEDAMTLISVDVINRTVKLAGFGAASDRTLTY